MQVIEIYDDELVKFLEIKDIKPLPHKGIDGCCLYSCTEELEIILNKNYNNSNMYKKTQMKLRF